MMRPKPGDIAYFVQCVEGGDPFRVVVCYKYFHPHQLDPPDLYGGGRYGWYNTQGIMRPLMDEHPGLKHLRLVARDGRIEVWGFPVAQYAEDEYEKYVADAWKWYNGLEDLNIE